MASKNNFQYLTDPLELQRILWPGDAFYKEQEEVVYSVWNNYETQVPAGNELGKDYVAGFIATVFFIIHHPCRIVTTSATDRHLRVLWGEIMQRIQSSKYPLDVNRGGLFEINHQHIRKVYRGELCPKSYMMSMVASPDTIASMQGHHIADQGDGIPRTLFICDEASSVPHDYYKMATGWANRILILGNPWPCNNFFRIGVRGGDIPSDDGKSYLRKIIRIKATDSPNVKLAMAERAAGKEPSGTQIIPGVKSWEKYQRNLKLWDKIQQCVALEAEFYEGAEVLLFPPDWLNHAEQLARDLKAGGQRRQARGIGCDSAEGGDRTVWTVVDEYGVLWQGGMKTPDTSMIPAYTLELMRGWSVPAERVCFDRGGGGKQHVDRMRNMGHRVRSVGFGEAVLLDLKRGLIQIEVRRDNREDRYVYKNRRAEMYGELSILLDPTTPARRGSVEASGFAIPDEYSELRRQLSLIPKMYDSEDQLFLPPKHRKAGQKEKPDEVTLDKLIGHSPDEADSLVLAVHAMLHKAVRATAGVY